MLTDPIADMIVRIRNGYRAAKKEVVMPSSKLKENIARILKKERFIRHFEIMQQGKKPVLRLILHYSREKEPALVGIERVSKPGKRVYVRKDNIKEVAGGLGIAILSTSKGVILDAEARAQGVGGELLCRVW